MIKDIKAHYQAIFASEEYARRFHPGADAPKKRKRRAMAPDSLPDVTPTNMLRLAVVARIAFPDGSVSSGALRREGIAGRLKVYRIAGKDFTTLADIEDMKCHAQAKVQDSGFVPLGVTEPLSTSSSIEERKSALAAARAMLLEPSAPCKIISDASTTQPMPSAIVIPIKSR